MSTSNLSSEEIRAAAETHSELGPEYRDAVVESFLAKVEKEIEARVDARLAASPPAPGRQLDAATLARRRLALRYMALGSVGAAIPLSIFSRWVYDHPMSPGFWLLSLAVVWILIGAAYVACAVRLRPSRRGDRS
jgi:uncharacterized membrane protein YeaQ/YmgE (transglycosylase-associated protein family)